MATVLQAEHRTVEPRASSDAGRENRFRAFYNSAAALQEEAERQDQAYLEHYVTFVTAHVPLYSAVLDVGCGIGDSSAMLARRGYRTAGVDFSQTLLTYGKSRHTQQDYVCGDLWNLPFADGALDAVAGTRFIEYVSDVPHCLSECWRVLRPGGRLLIVGTNFCSPFFALDLVTRQVLARDRGRGLRPLRRLFAQNIRATWRKLHRRDPRWEYCTPDLEQRYPDLHSHVAYRSCPIDLERWFRARTDARIIRLSMGTSVKSRLIAQLLPRWSPFIGVVVEKRR